MARAYEIELRESYDADAYEKVVDIGATIPNPTYPDYRVWVGGVTARISRDGLGHVGDLRACTDAPYGTAWAILANCALWLQDEEAVGVVIHVEGKNVTRRHYRRLGFRPVHGCPMLLSAPLSEILEAMGEDPLEKDG